jgi:hypothetical protein
MRGVAVVRVGHAATASRPATFEPGARPIAISLDAAGGWLQASPVA